MISKVAYLLHFKVKYSEATFFKDLCGGFLCLNVIYFIPKYAQMCVQDQIVCMFISVHPWFLEMGRRKTPQYQ